MIRSIYDLEFLTPQQIAAALQVSPETVQRIIKRGQLKAIRIGKQYRITQNDFRDYMKGIETNA